MKDFGTRIGSGFVAYDPGTTMDGYLRLDRTEPPLPICGEGFVPGNANAYPNTTHLAGLLGDRWNVDPDRLIVTAGADEALDRICRAFLDSTRNVVTTSPTFEMIGKYAQLAHAETISYPWLDQPFSVERFLPYVSDDTALIILVTPNNPTGQQIPINNLLRIADTFPEKLLVIDLAYVEFADSDPTPELLTRENVVVVRTFSKAWGLPGARVGYALAAPQVIATLRIAGGPYSVSNPSLALVENALVNGDSNMQTYVREIRSQRQQLEDWLIAHNVRFITSQANFLFIFPSDPANFDNVLAGYKMVSRRFTGMPEARRLTLPGNWDSFSFLLKALDATLCAERFSTSLL